MRLTSFTDYSLRVLMYAALSPERLVTIGELAETYRISANHLMKVVHLLGQHGYLQTVRGKGGGLRLGRAPAQINLGELVRLTEGSDALVECFGSEHADCRIAQVCLLFGVLHEAQEAFFGTLGHYTLASLLDRPEPLSHALGLTIPIRPLMP